LRVPQIFPEAFPKAEQLYRCAFDPNLILMLFCFLFCSNVALTGLAKLARDLRMQSA